MAEERTLLERLEALSRDVEEVATSVAVRARAFGREVGARQRVDLVKQRLKVALDELDGFPMTADDITDE
ncbi:MAG: hypothetical protein JOZ24_07005 [Candidatus Eremiobacteraeota bacterium]|nr:hypothetical protein [Candidatus Eremiobacteraeota bacterium]